MKNFHDTMHGGRFLFFEIKTAQIRKLLLGSLSGKRYVERRSTRDPRGLGILKTVEEAADEFIDPSIADSLAKLDNALSIINTHAPL